MRYIKHDAVNWRQWPCRSSSGSLSLEPSSTPFSHLVGTYRTVSPDHRGHENAVSLRASTEAAAATVPSCLTFSCTAERRCPIWSTTEEVLRADERMKDRLQLVGIFLPLILCSYPPTPPTRTPNKNKKQSPSLPSNLTGLIDSLCYLLV